MFHPGDIVSYGTNGVCTITEQKRMRLAGQPCDCFILKPVYDHSMTICVPCTSQVLLDRMRPLPTREELLSLLHEPAPTHEPDNDARKEQYRQALQGGDRRDLLRMVRDIHAQRKARKAQGKALSTFDDHALHEAQTLLHSEFAYILGIEPNAVPQFIAAELGDE